MRPRPIDLAVSALLVLPGAVGATTWQVSVQNFSYSPQVVRVRIGDSVQWTNNNGTHSVLADDGSFRCANGCDDTGGNGAPAASWSFSRVFPDRGSFPYHCELHGLGMAGTVVVEPDPDEVVTTLTAWDFETVYGETAASATRDLTRELTASGPTGLAAGLHLPSGSAPTRLEIEACGDTAGVGNAFLQARLVVCPLNVATCAPAVTVSENFPDAGACGIYHAELSGLSIANLDSSYFVTVDLSGDNVGDAVSFRAVRVFYKRQVGPAPAQATFTDVASGSLYFQYVEALAAAGVMTGCGGDNFCPDNPVTRAQLAVFLAKLIGLWPN